MVGKTGGFHARMRSSNASFAYSTDELAGRPECGQLDFESSLQGKLYQDPECVAA